MNHRDPRSESEPERTERSMRAHQVVVDANLFLSEKHQRLNRQWAEDLIPEQADFRRIVRLMKRALQDPHLRAILDEKASRALTQKGLRDRPAIVAPPGCRLARMVTFVLPPKRAEVFTSALADMQHEYFEALAAGGPREAARIRFWGYWSFWSAIVAMLPVSLLRMVAKLWRIGS